VTASFLAFPGSTNGVLIAAGDIGNGSRGIVVGSGGGMAGPVGFFAANVVTLADSTAVDLCNITTTGNVSVTAVGISQESGATLDAGSGAITLNGGGGNITAGGTLTTTSSSANTLQVQSGNVVWRFRHPVQEVPVQFPHLAVHVGRRGQAALQRM
jgi:hypothetical protein